MKKRDLFPALLFLSVGLAFGILVAARLDIVPFAQSEGIKPVMTQPIKQVVSANQDKPITGGWLGVTIQALNTDFAKYFGLSDDSGALVATVIEGSPAQKAGLEAGDVIKRLNKTDIKNIDGLLNFVTSAKIGTPVEILVIRNQKELHLNGLIGSKPAIDETDTTPVVSAIEGWRGLSVVDLSPDLQSYLGVEGKKGIVVINVMMASPAEASGIMPGDLICEINRQPVSNYDDYQTVIKDLKGDVMIRAARGFFMIKEVGQE